MKYLFALIITITSLIANARTTEINESNIMGSYFVRLADNTRSLEFTLGRSGQSRRATIVLDTDETLQGTWSYDGETGRIKLLTTRYNENLEIEFFFGKRYLESLYEGVSAVLTGYNTTGQGRVVILTKID
jgi:hypothetical protein